MVRVADKLGLFSRAVCVCWLLAGIAHAAVSISNPSFEELDAQGFPAGWQVTPAGEPVHEEGGETHVRVLNGDAHDGKHAIELEGFVSSFPCFVDQKLDAQGKGPLPPKGTIGFWYKVLEGNLQRAAVNVMGVKPPSRDYPGGFFIPMTFAADGQWHYAQLGYDLSASKVESAFIRIFLMSFESPYPAHVRVAFDDFKFIENPAPWVAPKLLHLIENEQDTNTCELRLYVRNMSHETYDAKFKIELPEGLATAGALEQNVHLEPGPAHGLHGSDGSGAGVVKWNLNGTRTAGDVIKVHWLGPSAPDAWSWSRRLQPDLQIESARFSHGLFPIYGKGTIDVTLFNRGDAPSIKSALTLHINSTLRPNGRAGQTLEGAVGAGRRATLSLPIVARMEGSATATVKLHCSDQPSTRSEMRALAWVNRNVQHLAPSTHTTQRNLQEIISAGNLTLSLGPRVTGQSASTVSAVEEIQHMWEGYKQTEYSALNLSYADEGKFKPLAVSPFLARVIYLDNGNQVERLIRYAPAPPVTSDTLALQSAWQDADGAQWKSAMQFQPDAAHEKIDFSITLSASAPRQVLFFSGPWMLAGDGSYGVEKASAQLPGIDWLIDNEMSSSQSTIPGLRDQTVPHPNRITVPLAAIVNDKKMIGITWDPLQKWDGEHDRPALIFDSPNRKLNQKNHLVGLFLPSAPQWVQPATALAVKPFELTPGKQLSLSFSIFSGPADNDIAPVKKWYAINGAPEPPPLDRTYDEEMQMCKIEPVEKRDLKAYIERLIPRAETARSRQLNSGWWPWGYNGTLINNTLNWTHSGNFDLFGLPGEQAIGGYSPNWSDKLGNADMIRLARITGDRILTKFSQRALDAGMQFRRPEGAQPWELPLHTADLLAAGYGVNFYIEGFRLTGDEKWLKQAQYWAETGLPFIYTWAAQDQPYMRYGTIAVYGGSFMDYTLLGQTITWVGLDYADSLVGLVRSGIADPWNKIAEGVINNVVLQHDKSGVHAMSWPDWREMRTNRVIADIWYRDDPKPGVSLRRWAGKDFDPQTIRVKASTSDLHVTTNGEAESAGYEQGHLKLKIRALGQNSVEIAIGGIKPVVAQTPSASYNEKFHFAVFSVPATGAEFQDIDLAIDPLD